jgi:monolysocardiolipin acyltransferase
VLPIVSQIPYSDGLVPGFDSLMPEGRRFPFKYIPRIGVDLSVTIGEPLSLKDIEAGLDPWREEVRRPSSNGDRMTGDTVEDIDLEKDRVRSNVTAVVQNAVETLGRGVSGNFLRRSAKE